MFANDTNAGLLFRHVTAERAEFYRAIMQVFAAAERQFRLHLRPDEVRAEATWPAGERPAEEQVQQALSQLSEWGNLVAQPDTARVASIEDFYRARFLYRLSPGGEAVEVAMVAFVHALTRRAELQTVALEDILARLRTLRTLAATSPLDAGKVHEALRDLLGVFTSLAENAHAFMAGLARTIELQRVDAASLMTYKKKLIDYLERFIGDLVVCSSQIAGHLSALEPNTEALLTVAAAREARDAAPGDDLAEAEVFAQKLAAWRERWTGLSAWFVRRGDTPSQSDLLRSRARSAIPQLLSAIAQLNERRSGRSDRSADFRVLSRWFAECETEEQAHRLFRAAFALGPARHLALQVAERDVPASTPWPQAPALAIHPKLRERGTLSPRGAPPKVQDRSRERALLARQIAEEQAKHDAALRRLARGRPVLLSELGPLDRHELRLLLTLLGEALAAQIQPDTCVERLSGDGTLRVRLEPLDARQEAVIHTADGILRGRDHRLTVTLVEPS